MMAAQHRTPGEEAALAEQNRRLRQDVVHRHAVLRDGKPVFCHAAHGKIIYPTMEAAVAAGAELALLGVGRTPQSAYECGRSGHYHLYTDTPRRMRSG